MPNSVSARFWLCHVNGHIKTIQNDIPHNRGQAKGYGQFWTYHSEWVLPTLKTWKLKNGWILSWAFPGYKNLGYLLPYAIAFMSFYRMVFSKNINKYWSLTLQCDQTTCPTTNTKGIIGKTTSIWPYLSFGTLRFEIDPPVRSQWPFEHHGPLQALAKNECHVHIL